MQIKGTKLVLQRQSKDRWLSWLPVLFWLANLYRMTGHGPTAYLITLYGVGIIGVIKIILDHKMLNSKLSQFALLYFITGAMNWLLIGNLGFRDLVNDVLLFGILITMFAYPQTYKNGLVCYYASAIFFITAYFSGRYAYTLLTSSGNYVSVLLVLSAAYYYFCIDNSDRDFKVLNILPALLSFLLAIWARGRGGILASTVLLVLVLIHYVRNYAQKSTGRYLIAAIAIVIIVAVLFFRNVNLLDTFLSLGKWQYRGIDNTFRSVIWGSYVNEAKSNILYIIFGAPLDKITIIHAYENNTHNSFIQLHAYNGLFTFIAFIVIAIRSLIYEFRRGRNLTAIAMVAVIVRGMSDKFIFGQYGMPIMLYLVFWPYMESYIQNAKSKLVRNTSEWSALHIGQDGTNRT